MKNYSSNTTAYRAAGKAHWQVNLLSFRVREGDGDPVWFHFTSGDEDETTTITDPSTGSPAARTYLGGGHIVALDPLVRSEGGVVHSFALALSGASSVVLDMVENYNCRDAEFEWHIGELDQDAGLLVDTPVCEFVGFIETIEHEDGGLAVDGDEPADSVVSVSVVSLAAALLPVNPEMRSLDVSQQRSGDKLFKYSESAHQWNIRWGKESKSQKKNGGGKGDGKSPGKGGDR